MHQCLPGQQYRICIYRKRDSKRERESCIDIDIYTYSFIKNKLLQTPYMNKSRDAYCKLEHFAPGCPPVPWILRIPCSMEYPGVPWGPREQLQTFNGTTVTDCQKSIKRGLPKVAEAWTGKARASGRGRDRAKISKGKCGGKIRRTNYPWGPRGNFQ